ncbi:Ig-like domain-containing protein [Nocardioides donggukensis]|uniref:Uncharacterized protein n=1 Tax=Nocardioides donggukensis TaxID=2774019 RepID=A0A927K7T3_9ACTN|nr:hypothetical protein [Nocardioides donggukensis]MBD8870578.1 hypothetical protein [Nocardioides donggukensis]
MLAAFLACVLVSPLGPAAASAEEPGDNVPPLTFNTTLWVEAGTNFRHQLIALEANYYDILRWTVLSPPDPAHDFALSRFEGVVELSPPAGFIGTTTTTYQVEDTGGLTDTATATFKIYERVTAEGEDSLGQVTWTNPNDDGFLLTWGPTGDPDANGIWLPAGSTVTRSTDLAHIEWEAFTQVQHEIDERGDIVHPKVVLGSGPTTVLQHRPDGDVSLRCDRRRVRLVLDNSGSTTPSHYRTRVGSARTSLSVAAEQRQVLTVGTRGMRPGARLVVRVDGLDGGDPSTLVRSRVPRACT